MASTKTAIVTGAGQGIGFEICRELAREGVSVLLNDVSEELANKAAKQIESEAGICKPFPGDISDVDVIRKMVDEAVARFGRLDFAIANAGITLFGEFLKFSRESFDRVLGVNLAGSFFFAQAAANQMIRQGGGGAIVFTSSVTGRRAHKDLAAYGMTKAAIEMLAKYLVIELSPYRINVNCVAPGATVTERTMEDTDYEKTWSRITPMGRPAYPADIARAVLFLISEKASHITGQTLVVDGGWTTLTPSPSS